MNEAYSEWFEKFKDCTDQLDSDRLYESFRSSLSHSRSTIALNRRILEKDIDVSWVEAIETGLVSIDNVIRNPSKTITNVEEVVPIALSKKITVDSVKHLAQHTDLIQSVDPETGKITPSKVLNIHKEESYLTYENKFVNTLIDRLFIFVNKRYEKLKAVSSSEEVFAMEYNTAFESGSGRKMKMTLNIETSDSLEAADENGSTLWDRVEKIRRIVEGYKSSPFCQQMGQNYIRPPVMRTNAIMKNVDLKACLVLWQFIEGYDKTGYEINVSDSAQKPDKEYVENLYDLSALNLLLFRSFTQDSEAEVLKTQKSKAAAPRVLRKFDKVSYDEHELVIGSDRLTDDAALAQDNISENEKILAEIDKIIKIETEYYKAEEQKRLEAEEKERRRQEEERRIEEERRLAREKAEREEQERKKHERIAREQAQQHCRLSKLIRHGVNDLAEVAYHIEAARDISVGRVGYPGQREQRRGFPEVLFYAVGIDEKRDKNKPEHGKHIRYGDAIFPDTAFLGLFIQYMPPPLFKYLTGNLTTECQINFKYC